MPKMNQFYNIPNDPFAATVDDISEYYRVQSTSKGGSYNDITASTAVNYPVNTPTRLFLELPQRVDRSDLSGTRPITVTDETVAVDLTRVTGAPTGNEYRISPESSIRRDIIEISSTKTGNSISYDYYGLGSVLNEDEVNVWREFYITTHTPAADYTVTDGDGYRNISCQHSSTTGLITITLPTATDNSGRRIKVVNDGNGLTKVDGEGAEVINWKGENLTYVYLYMDGDYIDLVCDGTEWFVDSAYSHIPVGWQNRSDWTNVHIGNGVTYDNGSAASTKSVDWTGQKITEATSGITAVILEDTGGAGTSGTFYFYNVDGVGYFTNNRVLTAGNGETIDVNEASGSSKNIDYNLFHDFGVNYHKIIRVFIYNTSASFTGAIEVVDENFSSAVNLGITMIQVSTAAMKWQTGNAGFGYIPDDGTNEVVNTDDSYAFLLLEFKV
jgi:hypothetical protein